MVNEIGCTGYIIMKKTRLASFLSCSGQRLTDEEKKLFEKYCPAGITLFSRNIDNANQVRKLIEEIKQVSGDDILIAVDQEGGRVRRLKEPEFMSYAAQSQIGSLPLNKALKMAKLHARLISNDLKKLGIDVNFAPVLDIMREDTTDALKSRCFSDDGKRVARLGKISVDEYIKSGIIPCIKHMPGHGRAVCDPHLGLPIINDCLENLMNDFMPFKECNYAPMGMTAHILLKGLGYNRPITQCVRGIKEIIRKIIGFNGFLISDAIDMNALQGDVVERAKLALRAGCDCVCYCMGKIDEMGYLAENCPQLSDEAMQRLDKAKQILHNKYIGKEISDREQYSLMCCQVSDYDEKYDATEVLHRMQRKSLC